MSDNNKISDNKLKKQEQKKLTLESKKQLEFFENEDDNQSDVVKQKVVENKREISKQVNHIVDALSTSSLSNVVHLYNNNNDNNNNDNESIEFNRFYKPLLMNAYTMMLTPNRLNNIGEEAYKKFYEYVNTNTELCLKLLDITQCEYSIGVLGILLYHY